MFHILFIFIFLSFEIDTIQASGSEHISLPATLLNSEDVSQYLEMCTAIHESGHAIAMISAPTAHIINHINIVPTSTNFGSLEFSQVYPDQSLSEYEKNNMRMFAWSGIVAQQVLDTLPIVGYSTEALLDRRKIFLLFCRKILKEDLKVYIKNSHAISARGLLLKNKFVDQLISNPEKSYHQLAEYQPEFLDTLIHDYWNSYQCIFSNKRKIIKLADFLLSKKDITGDQVYKLFNQDKLLGHQVSQNLNASGLLTDHSDLIMSEKNHLCIVPISRSIGVSCHADLHKKQHMKKKRIVRLIEEID